MVAPFTNPHALNAYVTRNGGLPHQQLTIHVQGWTIEDCVLVKRLILQNEARFATIPHVAISGIESLPCFNILATVIGYVSGPKLERVFLSFSDSVDFEESNENRDDLKGFKNLFYQTENLQTLDLANGNWNAVTLEDLRRHLHESDECVNKLSTVTSLRLRIIMSEKKVAILENFIQSCDSLVTFVLDAGADRDVCTFVSSLLCDLHTDGYLRHLGKQQLKLENGRYSDDSIAALGELFVGVLNVTGNVVDEQENTSEDDADENVNVDEDEDNHFFDGDLTQNLFQGFD
jgi:hypothetical protein